MTTFTQKLIGNVSFFSVPGTPHCGPKDGYQTFPVNVTIQYSTATVLDPNGFLLDNAKLREYLSFFDDSRLQISCEKLCLLIVSDLSEMLNSHGIHFESIHAEVYGIPGVASVVANHYPYRKPRTRSSKFSARRKPLDTKQFPSVRPDDFMLPQFEDATKGVA